LVISKAHCCEVYYAALAELGYFPKEELVTYSKICSNLQVHVDCRTPGVECSGGSLGLGLSFAAGTAMGAYISPDKRNLSAMDRGQAARYRVYCILGDGECNEGEVWEAAANAAHYRLDNLIAIVDNNKFQSTGPIEEKMNIMSLSAIFKAFGWETVDIDGNDIGAVVEALDWADSATSKPKAIVAHTLKGKGFPELEGTNCHFIKITDETLEKGLEVLTG
jgi:transketolase